MRWLKQLTSEGASQVPQLQQACSHALTAASHASAVCSAAVSTCILRCTARLHRLSTLSASERREQASHAMTQSQLIIPTSPYFGTSHNILLTEPCKRYTRSPQVVSGQVLGGPLPTRTSMIRKRTTPKEAGARPRKRVRPREPRRLQSVLPGY